MIIYSVCPFLSDLSRTYQPGHILSTSVRVSVCLVLSTLSHLSILPCLFRLFPLFILARCCHRDRRSLLHPIVSACMSSNYSCQSGAKVPSLLCRKVDAERGGINYIAARQERCHLELLHSAARHPAGLRLGGDFRGWLGRTEMPHMMRNLGTAKLRRAQLGPIRVSVDPIEPGGD